MEFNVIVGNPPYNDGSAGRSPIYQKFLHKLISFSPVDTVFVIPTNWMSQPDAKLGKDVRAYLKQLGVYDIQINPINAFEGARVNTCTVFCKKDYTGPVTLFNENRTKHYVIREFDQRIIIEFNNTSRSLLLRLKPEQPNSTHAGNKKDTNSFRVVTSYMCYNNLSEAPLNELKVIEPNYPKQSGYRVFASFDSAELANEHLAYLNSFWHSKLVQFILKKTRTSTTLDNPQISWVPNIILNRKFTNDDLYAYFGLTQEEIDYVEANS